MDWVRFETLLTAAFQGGQVTRRELRLTEGECDYLRRNHPAFSLKLMQPSGEKSWYDISLKEAH